MLIHHSGQEYNIAASEAAREARTKFQAQIDRGRERALAVVNQIESQVPTDRVVTAAGLTFTVSGEDIHVIFPDREGTAEKFHRHAVGQAAAKAEIPLGYIDKLMQKGSWGRELVAENLNRLYGNMDTKVRMLTRSVDAQVRGFLSDSYRRMDSRPIVDQFISAMQQFGAVVLDGYALETKIAIQAVLPFVFEPVPNEVMIYGVSLGNSDFGNGALSLRTFIQRLYCTNRAISTEELRKIHLGARLGDDLELSAETYRLDTLTMASATKDIVTKSLSASSVNDFMNSIQKANQAKVEPHQMLEFLKKNLSKGEQEKVIDAYNSPDVENLPPGNTKWRLSNAISFIANTLPEDRQLEVMAIAGMALDSKNRAVPPLNTDLELVAVAA